MAHLVVGSSQKGGEGMERAVESPFSPYYCICRDVEVLEKMDEDSTISEESGST
jgi:hypothetical protein